MDLKVKGIVLKSIDINENDKLLTILTLEKGKILVKAKGVKKQKAKFKAFAQSFCFANFELSSTNSNCFILTGVDEVETFFDLSSDFDIFENAFAIIEISDKICQEGIFYPQIFLEILKCFKTLMEVKGKELKNKGEISRLCLLKFMISVLNFEGVNLNLSKCSYCKTPFVSKVYLDLDSGEVLCVACKNPFSIELENSTFSALKILSFSDYSKVFSIKLKQSIIENTLNILLRCFFSRFNIKLNSINF